MDVAADDEEQMQVASDMTTDDAPPRIPSLIPQQGLLSLSSVASTDPDARPQKSEAGGTVTLDFRNGELPVGVEVVNGEPEFVQQQDGSTALKLSSLSYLRIQEEALHSLAGAGKLLNRYTLTMDIYIEKLQDSPVSLYQAQGKFDCFVLREIYYFANIFSWPNAIQRTRRAQLRENVSYTRAGGLVFLEKSAWPTPVYGSNVGHGWL